MCCDSWGRKESDTTERLNWFELKNSLMEICTNPPLASHPVQISSFACCVCVCGMWAFSSCGTQVYLPPSMWEFSTHPRDQTSVPCTGRWICSSWTTREVPCLASNKSFFAGFPTSVNLFLIHATPQPAHHQ